MKSLDHRAIERKDRTQTGIFLGVGFPLPFSGLEGSLSCSEVLDRLLLGLQLRGKAHLDVDRGGLPGSTRVLSVSSECSRRGEEGASLPSSIGRNSQYFNNELFRAWIYFKSFELDNMAHLEQLHQASDITRLDRAARKVIRYLRDSSFDINTIMLWGCEPRERSSLGRGWLTLKLQASFWNSSYPSIFLAISSK